MEIFIHSFGDTGSTFNGATNECLSWIRPRSRTYFEVNCLLEIASHTEVQCWRTVQDFVHGFRIQVLH